MTKKAEGPRTLTRWSLKCLADFHNVSIEIPFLVCESRQRIKKPCARHSRICLGDEFVPCNTLRNERQSRSFVTLYFSPEERQKWHTHSSISLRVPQPAYFAEPRSWSRRLRTAVWVYRASIYLYGSLKLAGIVIPATKVTFLHRYDQGQNYTTKTKNQFRRCSE